MISRLRQAKHRRAEKQLAVNVEKKNLADVRTTRYHARKALDLLKSRNKKDNQKRKRREDAEPDNNYPTPQKPGCEDFPEHMKLENLPGATITYAETDYGVVTMSATASIPFPHYNFHVELYNNYQALEGHDDQSAINLGDNNKQFPQLPKPFRSTAKDLDWTPRSRAARKAERGKRTTHRKDELQAKRRSCFLITVSNRQTLYGKSIAQKSCGSLPTFYKSKVELKNRKFLNMKKDQTYRKKTLEERTYELVLAFELRDMREEVETG
ncbi:hypothetical protein DFQ28_006437 [Apophysomyces sp. BC1034]|nr:hypothetical protein DFQ30_004510 [Apophysomyces sp. BC1015]KAG0177221.1 hypothetical protein DFQ29_005083 [Apophysomyces sp. BC1021]KAG0187369.1 hypothetical protein DFQ28_006437 [Apophysomyces sp. BC1034]